MAKKSNNIASPMGNTAKSNRRKTCDSSNHLPVVACAVVCLPSLTRQVSISRFFVALLIVSNYIQRYSLPLTGAIAGENKGVKPHGLSAVLWGRFMC